MVVYPFFKRARRIPVDKSSCDVEITHHTCSRWYPNDFDIL